MSVRFGIPYVVSIRGGDVPGCEKKLKILHATLQPIRRMVLSSSKAIVANSKDLADKSEEADPYRVKIIPNGIDIEYFRPGSRLVSANNNQPLGLLFVGRF